MLEVVAVAAAIFNRNVIGLELLPIPDSKRLSLPPQPRSSVFIPTINLLGSYKVVATPQTLLNSAALIEKLFREFSPSVAFQFY